MNDWIENHVWTFALIPMAVLAPFIIWGSWDTIDNAESMAVRAVLCAGIIGITYVGAGLLLMWNRWIQRKYREKGIIK